MKTYKEYLKYATKLAMKWRHSKHKIKEKLLIKGASNIIADKIINDLVNENVINDEKAFSIDVFIMEEKRYGYKRVREYLLNKGYSNKLVSTYIFNKDIERDNCQFFFQKGINKYLNYRYIESEKEKLINYLKRYGFNDKIIYEIVRLGNNYENVM